MRLLAFTLKGPLKGKFDIIEKCSMCDFRTYIFHFLLFKYFLPSNLIILYLYFKLFYKIKKIKINNNKSLVKSGWLISCANAEITLPLDIVSKKIQLKKCFRIIFE